MNFKRPGFLRRLPVFFGLLVVAGLATWTGVQHNDLFGGRLVVVAGNTQCNGTGTLPPNEYTDVEVPNGGSCTINSSDIIDHDLKVDQGATLHDTGASIGHDLHADHSSNLFIGGSSGYTSGNAQIGHDLHADGPNQAQVTNTQVGHDAQINNVSGGGADYFRNSCVGHDLQFNNGQNTGGSIDVSNDNGVQCGQSVGVVNDLHVENNQEPVTVDANTVGHDFHVSNNRPGGASVMGNQIGNNAECHDDQPFTGSGNTAGGNIDGCNGSAPPPPPSGTTNCSGPLPPGSYNNVVVPSGTCTLSSGDNITGDVQVQQGASLVSNGANIGGQLHGDHPKQIQLDGTNVGHDLNIDGITGPGSDHICSSNVGGNLQVQNGQSGAGTFVIGDTSTGCATGTNVTHDLNVQNNQNAVDVSDNNVGNNLQVNNNTPGGATVKSNNVSSQAQCQGNSPFAGGGNATPPGRNQGCG